MEEKTVDSLIKDIVNSVTGTEVTVDEQQVQSLFHQIAPNLAILCVRIIVAIILWLVGKKMMRWLNNIVDKALIHYRANDTMRAIAGGTIKTIGYALILLYIARIFQLPLTPLYTILGSIAIGVALALKEYLANLAGGLILICLTPFRFGDYIIDEHGHEGTVTRVGMLYTTLMTLDGKTIFVPNSLLTKDCVTNVTKEGRRRIELKIGISYESNLKRAKEIMEEVIGKENHLEDPPIQVFVGELEEDSIIVQAYFWTTVDDYWPVLRDIKEKVKDAYDKEGISIPLPQVDIRLLHQAD